MAQLNKEFQEKIDFVLSRVQNIDFFQQKNLADANSLVPQIEKILTDSRFPSWLETDFSFKLPKSVAYQNKSYLKVSNVVKTSVEMIKRKLNSKINEFFKEASERYIGGFDFFFHCRRYILKEVSRNIALYMWWETTKDPNPFESCIKFYELGLRPRGLKQILELKIRESSTEPEPLEEMFRPDKEYTGLSHYSQFSSLKPVVDFPLIGKDVTSPVRFYKGEMTFTTPSSLDRSCLGCYTKGDNEIKYVHYWTEDCDYYLRPLGMENVISFFNQYYPQDEDDNINLHYTARRKIRNLDDDLLLCPSRFFVNKKDFDKFFNSK